MGSETPLLVLRHPRGQVLCPPLDDLNLSVVPGECVAVAGDPGAGKSLLLRFAAGLEPLLTGERRCRASRLGFAFESGGLVSNLTVRENVLLPLSYRWLSPRDASRRTEEALERFALEEVAEERPARLSNELRALAQLARIAALEVDLALLDELFIQLSPPARSLAAGWLRETREQRGTGVLMTSVYSSSIERLADRTLLLTPPAPSEAEP